MKPSASSSSSSSAPRGAARVTSAGRSGTGPARVVPARPPAHLVVAKAELEADAVLRAFATLKEKRERQTAAAAAAAVTPAARRVGGSVTSVARGNGALNTPEQPARSSRDAAWVAVTNDDTSSTPAFSVMTVPPIETAQASMYVSPNTSQRVTAAAAAAQTVSAAVSPDASTTEEGEAEGEANDDSDILPSAVERRPSRRDLQSPHTTSTTSSSFTSAASAGASSRAPAPAPLSPPPRARLHATSPPFVAVVGERQQHQTQQRYSAAGAGAFGYSKRRAASPSPVPEPEEVATASWMAAALARREVVARAMAAATEVTQRVAEASASAAAARSNSRNSSRATSPLQQEARAMAATSSSSENSSRLFLLPALAQSVDKARALRSSHSRMALEIAALLSQTSKSISSLSATCIARTARADDALRHARIVHARQAGEIVALQSSLAQKEAALAASALHASFLSEKIGGLEATLAKQAMQARCMRDALADATGCVRVVVRVRPLLPCDLAEDAATGVAIRWLLRSYLASINSSNSSSSNSRRPLISLHQLAASLGWREEGGGDSLLAAVGGRERLLQQQHNGNVHSSHADVGAVLLSLGSTPDDMKMRLLELAPVPESEMMMMITMTSGATTTSSPTLPGKAAARVLGPMRSRAAALESFVEKCASRASSAGNVFAFDRVFSEEEETEAEKGGEESRNRSSGSVSQAEDIFDEISPLLDSALRGRNVTVLAYGATGAGKTHTLFGHSSEKEAGSMAGVGGRQGAGGSILPRALSYLCCALKQENSSRTITMSIFEIYNDEVRDLLLLPSSAYSASRPAAGAAAGSNGLPPGLTFHTVTSWAETEPLLRAAIARRAQGSTVSNASSSRSHCIVRLSVHGAPPKSSSSSSAALFGTSLTSRRGGAGGANRTTSTGSNNNNNSNSNSSITREAIIQLVDLAGSERVRESRATGATLAEACSVNASLSAVGDCVAALVAGAPHIPYRNTRLTRVLEPTLSGNARALAIVCVSAATPQREATSASLRFAAKMAGTPVTRPEGEETSATIRQFLLRAGSAQSAAPAAAMVVAAKGAERSSVVGFGVSGTSGGGGGGGGL